MYVWQYLQYFISSKNNWNICKTMYFKAKSYIDKELSMWRIEKREIDYTGWKNDIFLIQQKRGITKKNLY